MAAHQLHPAPSARGIWPIFASDIKGQVSVSHCAVSGHCLKVFRMGKGEFKPGLESLRGIAALVVAMSHGRSAFIHQDGNSIVYFAINIFQPPSAIVVFFVLSGYVLGGSLAKNPDYPAFVVRRLFRILPAFLFAVLFAYAASTIVRIDPAPQILTPFFQSIFWPAPTWDDLWNNLLFQSFRVNGPTWSIWPELMGSAILPLVFFIHAKIPSRHQWWLFAIVATIFAFSQLRFFLYFYGGFFLVPRIALVIARYPMTRTIVLLSGLAILVAFGSAPVDFKARTIIPSGIGATLLVAGIASTAYRVLDAAPIRFLGRVSYSFYLLHWPIFYLCVIVALKGAGGSELPFGNLTLMVVSIAIALVAAWFSYRFVERPFMKIRFSGAVGRIAESQVK